jgi:rhodanese-related sulfurtransferase
MQWDRRDTMASKISWESQLHTRVFCAVLCLAVFLLNAYASPVNARANLTNNGSADVRGAVTCVNQTSASTVVDGTMGDVCEPEAWGGASNVVRMGHLFLSDHPDAVTISIAKGKGISLVINLCNPAEFHWDEKSAAKEAGLDYYNISLFGLDGSFNPPAIKQISTLVQQHQDDKILVHCSSGNRAAAWPFIW